MVVMTQAQKAETFKHLWTNVVPPRTGQQDLMFILQQNGIATIDDLLCTPDTWQETQAYTASRAITVEGKPSTERLTMKNFEVNQVFMIKDYIWNVVQELGHSSASDMTRDEYMALSRNAFDNFRLSPGYQSRREKTCVPITTNNPNPASIRSSNALKGPTEIDLFRKSVKRDPSVYTVIKDDDHFDTWNRGLRAMAEVQDVAHILEHKYAPTPNTDDEVLFAMKQKYMYAVFQKNILTDKGKEIVRKYTDTSDAQKIYAEYYQYCMDSINSRLGAKKYLAYITNSSLGDGKWHGTLHKYIIHWREQARTYNTMVPQAKKMGTEVLLQLLQNAVHPHHELRTVYTTAQLAETNGGKTLTFDQYYQLLETAAIAYDKSIEHQKPMKPNRGVYQSEHSNQGLRDVYQTEHTGDDYIFSESPSLMYDIDTTIQEIEAYQAFTRDPASNMGNQKWKRLSVSGKQTWDQLSEDDKAIILGPGLPIKPMQQLGHNSRPPMQKLGNKNFVRNLNLHEMTLSDISAADFLIAMNESHTTDPGYTTNDKGPDTATATVSEITPFQAYMTDKKATVDKTLHPAHLQRLMSSQNRTQGSKDSDNTSSASSAIHIKKADFDYGGQHFNIGRHEWHISAIQYQVSTSTSNNRGGLVDRGANGGVSGADVRVMFTHPVQVVDITGVENHQIRNVRLGTTGGVVHTLRGPVIAIFHQQALLGKHDSIFSCVQMEASGCDVNDRSMRLKHGLQRISKDGYIIPLNFRNGLPKLKIRPYTDQELATLPQVIMTDDIEWNPTILDNDWHEDDLTWYNAIIDEEDVGGTPDPIFDEYGEYRHNAIVNSAMVTEFYLTHDPALESSIIPTDDILYEAYPTSRIHHDVTPNWDELRDNFAGLPAQVVQKTFDCTTQYGRLPMGDKFQKMFKSPNPALNIPRRDEDLATDTVYSDTPAIDDGSTIAQIFFGCSSLVSDVIGIKTEGQFVHTLNDIIRKRGAPNRLISDRAQVEISAKVKSILRTLHIGDWQSEPHHQHQNPAERRYQDIKTRANYIMDRSGSPPYTWLLALLYVCFVFNITATPSLGWNCPLNVLTGTTHDCSPLLRFRWWQLVEYKEDDTIWPSESPTSIGHFVGFSENVGHSMTVKILTLDTLKVLHRGNVRSAENADHINWKALATLDGEKIPDIIKTLRYEHKMDIKEDDATTDGSENIDDSNDIKETRTDLKRIPMDDLIGRTFLLDTHEDGHRHRARIVEAIDKDQESFEKDPGRTEFRCSVDDDQYEEIMSYNEILRYADNFDEEQRIWKFKRITSHEGPLRNDHPHYMGSSYNVLIEWENGEVTREPLSTIAADDPVTCAIYAKEADLLEKPGWKRFKGIAKRQKKMFRMINQAKLRSFRTAPKYMYGFMVPRDYKHACQLDAINKNNKWQDSTHLEFEQIDEYETFLNLGKGGVPGPSYKKIRVHLIYAVKHDGRHKARCVADGHLTDVPLDSVYSGVVSLRGIRILIFLAELNGLETWGTDIGNAYLEAYTSELVYIIAGPEFGEREGSTLIIVKALYGLRSSGLQWHMRFSAVMRKEGFTPCKMEPDIWIRESQGIYEYVAVYVDDLAIAMANPSEFTDILLNRYGFKLKGTGHIKFHLGCDFHRDADGTLCMQPKKYIKKMADGYEMMFGEKPKSIYKTPLEPNDHPETDMSEILDQDDTAKYQSLIGSMQWAVSIGRMDIATAVMTMSSFRASPRRGHLERAKRMVGYLIKMSEAAIRFRTKLPDMSDLPYVPHDWDKSIYGEIREEVPDDAPIPLGNSISFVHYVDANLYHDYITGRSVTGIIHCVNQTPIDWYSKKQPKVETATYGSEFMAARTAVEQITDLRLTFRYLGVPIVGKSLMFGDNEAVVNSGSRVDAKLHKRHNALSFHKVREAVASDMIDFYHIPGQINPADILSKHWAYAKVWDLLRPLLFWFGDTGEILSSVLKTVSVRSGTAGSVRFHL